MRIILTWMRWDGFWRLTSSAFSALLSGCQPVWICILFYHVSSPFALAHCITKAHWNQRRWPRLPRNMRWGHWILWRNAMCNVCKALMAYSNKLFEQAGIPPNYLTLASVLNLGNLGRSCSILADLGVWTTANTLESRLDSEDVRGECGGLCSLLATIGSGQLWPRNAKKSTNGGQILAIREGLGWTRQRQGKGCSPRVLRIKYYKMLTDLLSIYNKMWKQNDLQPPERRLYRLYCLGSFGECYAVLCPEVLSTKLVDTWGRRTLLLWGSSTQTLAMATCSDTNGGPGRRETHHQQ